jgi:glycerophosphoryl diester phosphodiesterase
MNKVYSITPPVIFGHRGACAHAPENTLAAFQLALDHGADGIELDAKLTRDEQIVVIHDATVDRTTDGHGKVNQLTLSEIKRLDAGTSFSPQFGGEKIPTLEEVFGLIGKKLIINVELTNYTSYIDNLPKKVADLVIAHNLQDQIIFSSFGLLNLLRVRRVLPQAFVAALSFPGFPGMIERSWFGRWVAPMAIHPHYKDTTGELVGKQHSANRRVHVWTVNDPVEIKRLKNLSVDGIITDDPRFGRLSLGNT